MKRKEKKTYDAENLKPVIRASICTSERVAGFRNIHTGQFEEVMLLTSQDDLDEFARAVLFFEHRAEEKKIGGIS